MWLLDRARARPLKVSSLNPVAQGLRAYREFLDEFGIQWDDFSSVDKYLRPTYLYKTHVQDLINSGAIQHSTASGRMHTVVGLYRFLMVSERMGFRPQNAPWVDRTVGLEYRDTQGFKQVKEITTVDVSIQVPKRDYAWDRRINDGGKLLPLSRHEQRVLVRALKKLGNREYELMHYVSLLTGARIQTVLTLRWGAFAKPPSQINQWPFKLQCGPGTGIDTKGDVPDVYLSMQRDLYEWLHTYAISDRAKSRREKSNLKQDPTNYLFLSSQGSPHYESKDDRNAHRDSADPLKRSGSWPCNDTHLKPMNRCRPPLAPTKASPLPSLREGCAVGPRKGPEEPQADGHIGPSSVHVRRAVARHIGLAKLLIARSSDMSTCGASC